jgi:hypothetical protein
MPEVYLISQADIQKYHPIGEMPQGRIDPFIISAQELDLKPVLNESLYYDFITKYNISTDPMYADYQKLLNGTTYTYSGQTIQYSGLVAMLVAFTMARFIPINQVNITRYGIVNKKNETSEPVSTTQLTYIVNNLRAQAISYQNQLEQFLLQNQNTYPLYGSFPSAVNQRTGIKIINSTRSSHGGRYRGWWNGNYYD